MEIINSIFSWIIKKRYHQMELFMKYPLDVQNELLMSHLKLAKDTEWGKRFDFKSIKSAEEFKQQVPIQDYESLKKEILRIKHGEQNILWPSEIKWFAKSSGTTSDRSKFIPVSEESLEDCHYKGGKDLLSVYYNNYPDSKLMDGRGVVLGGSSEFNQFSKNGYYGDLSAIILKNLPFWADLHRTPSRDIALMGEWEAKMEKMVEVTSKQNVTNVAGVPSWTLVYLKQVLEATGKKQIIDVWPNFELYTHGGVSFEPYRQQYQDVIGGGEQVHYQETYNASEGFFGLQDQPNSRDLLLMLDYGIYYEFMPLSEVNKDRPKTLDLSQVELGVDYAIVINTNGGLWRYQLGDTVEFVCLEPFRIRVSGRVKQHINVFGEELMVANAEKALTKTSSELDCTIADFTVAPIFMEGNEKGAHEWVIEFQKAPKDVEQFAEILDQNIRDINSDYDAKRYKNMTLNRLRVHNIPRDSFYNWMASRGKLGGQNKVPRLANERKYVEGILEWLRQ